MCCQLVAAALFFLQLGAKVEAGNIRLRNELIETGSGTNRAKLAATMHAKVAASGLFLIQFSGPLEPARRAELRRAGVELLQYLRRTPLIAKFNNVSAANLEALNYVTWVGPYRTEHKIQSAAGDDHAGCGARPTGPSASTFCCHPAATAAGNRQPFAPILPVVHEREPLAARASSCAANCRPASLDALAQSERGALDRARAQTETGR